MIITKKTRIINTAELAGGSVLLIDKPKGKTSFDVVWWVRKKLQIKKVGHAGTLDPAATGLLIVCTGKKTKEISKFQEMHKIYSGDITLGASTDSMDSETELKEVKEVKQISDEEIFQIRDSFLGEIDQIPPMYSALKHNGKALYKYARQGVNIERTSRKVSIYNFKIEKINLPNISFEIECSKGTYIRVVANDFGLKTSYGGYLSKLRRTQIGDYDVNSALTLDELKNLTIENGFEEKANI